MSRLPSGQATAPYAFALRPLLLASALSPLAAQSFAYVHGGVGHRVEATTNDKVYVTFTGGVIRYTTNGADFVNANVPDDVRGTLHGLHFGTDALGEYAYCVGADGVVLFSTDGHTWTRRPTVFTPPTHPVNPNVPAELWDVWFSDRDHGWIVGYDHTLRETADGGSSWTDIAPAGHVAADNPEWYELHAFDSSEFVVVGDQGWTARRSPNGSVLATSIDEVLWCYAPQLATQPWDLELWAVQFVGDVGLAVGGVGTNDGYVFRSEDRGATWALDSACYAYLDPLAAGKTPPSFYGVELFGNANGGAVVGYASTVFKGGTWSGAAAPPDCPGCPAGGKAWKQFASDTDTNQTQDPEDDTAQPLLRDIDASPSNQRVYATGDFGVIRRSDDRGATWLDLAGLHRGRIACGDFADMQVGVLAGQSWRVFSTVDGGANCSLDYEAQIPIDPNTNEIYDGNFRDAAIAADGLRAVAAGDRGRLVVRDANGQWLDRSIGTWAGGPWLSSVLISSDGLGMLVGGAPDANGNTLWISADGGASAFVPLQLTYSGVPLTVSIVDIGFDGSYLYYLAANHRVYVAQLSSMTSVIAAVPVQGSTGNMTCLGVRSLTDFYVGDSAGQVFQFDGSGTSLQPVSLSPASLGGYVFSITPVPSSTEWWFTGDAGNVARYAGTWTTPKSSIGEAVVAASFFSASDGVLMGRKINVATW